MIDSQLNKSFFKGIDIRYGWGNMSFFTYFSEFGRSWQNLAYIEAAVLTTLFVLSTTGNIFILGFICKTKRSHTITNWFVINLTLADTLFSSSAPFVAYVRITGNWMLGEAMCNFLCYEMTLCGLVMLWTMAVISIDRYMCINLTTTRRMNHMHVIITCLCIWIIASIMFVPLVLFFHVKRIETLRGDVSFCTLVWPNINMSLSKIFVVSLLFLGFAVPIVIVVVSYSRILKKFWNSKRAVASIAVPSQVSSLRSSVGRDMRLVRPLIILVFLFIVMWAPLFVVFALIQIDQTRGSNSLPSSALVWTLVTAYANACVNPFLYGVINVEIQKTCLCCCSRPFTGGQTTANSTH